LIWTKPCDCRADRSGAARSSSTTAIDMPSPPTQQAHCRRQVEPCLKMFLDVWSLSRVARGNQVPRLPHARHREAPQAQSGDRPDAPAPLTGGTGVAARTAYSPRDRLSGSHRIICANRARDMRTATRVLVTGNVTLAHRAASRRCWMLWAQRPGGQCFTHGLPCRKRRCGNSMQYLPIDSVRYSVERDFRD
jgi:hypothetical protein